MKKNFEKIFNTTITIIGIIIIALAVKVINAEAHSYTEAVVGTPVSKEVEKEYSDPIPVEYKKINNFPINSSVFNSDADFFCIQHGVAYGIGGAPVQRGDDWVLGPNTTNVVGSSPDYHTIGNGNVGDKIKIKSDGTTDANVEDLTNLGIQGYKDSSETPKSSTYSNYYYKIFKNLKFGCEVEEYPEVKVVNEYTGAEETKELTFDGGLAFLLARYKLTDEDRVTTTYKNDPLQHAVWASLGQLDSYALKDAKAQFNQYHEDVQKTEKLPDVFPADDVGAVLDGSNYVVGPFKMNNYVRATDYVYEVKGVVQQDDYLVDPDALDASGEPINSNVDMGEKNLQMDFGDTKELYGGILEAKVIFNDGSEYVFANFDNKDVPAPNEEFNITIPESSISDSADEIKDIQFTYQIIHAYGEGEAYIGRQLVVSWSEETSKTEDGCSKYECTDCENDDIDKGNRSYIGGTHTVHCGGDGYCSDGYLNGYHPGELQCGKTEHTHTSSCYHTHTNSCKNEAGEYVCGESESSPNCGKTAHTHTYDCYCCGDTSYCVHGHSDGIHSGTCQSWGTSHDDEHVGHTVCSGHGHEDCKKITWKADSIYYDKCQDGAALAGKLTNSIDKYTIRVEVPLKTDMTIYKYITKVEHQTDKGAEHATCDRTYDGGDERRDWTIDQKKGDTVKVERGDKVYFKIELVNASRFPTKVLVKDTLPDSIQDPTRSDPKITWSTESTEDAWITVEANSTAEFEVTVIVDADSGAYVNKVEFVSLNEQEPHMKYSEWGDTATHGKHYNGNIVNINDTRLKDEDWYEVKEYDVSLDKSIIEVKHTTTDEATYSGTDRKNIEEATKEANPVYAEYGDTVTYEIDIYNTTKPYTEDRTAEPYWDPEVAFVDIEDTLPNKFTDLTVEVSNGTGSITTTASSFTVENIQVDPDSKTTVTVTLIVDEHTRETIEENTVKIKGKVKNINRYEVKNNPTKDETSDYYKINDYNTSINKYISDYDMKVMKENNSAELTNEESIVSDRSGMTEEEKKERPLQVEKGETVTYSIRVNNDAVPTDGGIPSAKKHATKVRPTEITESLQTGLEFKSVTAKVYKSDGTEKYGTDIPVTSADVGNNTYTLTIPNEIGGEMLILEPGEYIVYLVKVEVTESNMYLYELTNTAVISKLTNVNHTDTVPREVKNDDYDENISDKKTSSDYVKLKDLVIAGKVWLDRDKDGYMDLNASKKFDSYIDVENDGSSHIDYAEGSSEYAMKNIEVRLYTEDGTFVRSTKTNDQGLFTFGRDEDGTGWRAGTYSYDGSVTESDQRIPKANNKDTNKNYTEDSELINYYIEYYYDGVRYKSTTVYSGKTHLDENGNMDSEGLYEIDSNATESKALREEFNKKFEIIAYNKAYNADLSRSEDLSYTKEGHASWLNINHLRGSDGSDVDGIMRARSFLVVDANGYETGTDYLWLFKQGADYQLPETDYLKFINLGLEERLMDLKLTEDVYEVKTTINGEQMTYEYNQNEYVTGNTSIDKAHETDDYNSEYYMTGYISDASTLKNYDFRIYNSDYDYKYTQYPVETVRDYKTKDSELNIEATFRIRVTNQKPDGAVEGDEPCYAGINEIVQYYDKDFVKAEFNADGTVKKLNIKTKDANGYLQDTELNIVKAEYVMKDGTRKTAILSNDSKYNTARTLSSYNTLYIRPETTGTSTAGDVIIAQDESVDILITFVVDKHTLPDMNPEDLYVILGDKINIAEISAYSTYYKKEDGTYYSAGLVDQDSNPGNFGDMFTLSADKDVDSTEYLALFEDDNFKTGISMILQQKPGGPDFEEQRERMLTGFVWDDSRSEVALNVDGSHNNDGDQYIGDGKYDTSVNAETKQPNAKRNQAVSNKEVTDIQVQDVKATMTEIVRIPEVNASGTITGEKVYEQTIKTSDDSIMEMRTGADGKYGFKEYIPGEYVVKFTYGDDASLENMLIFNGQDYKSTTYQAGESTYAEALTDADAILDVLEKPGISDAKDDEIKRLETVSYSEVMTNELNRILRGKDSIAKETLVSRTNMESETAKFLVRTEKERGAKVTLTYSETMDKFIKNIRHPIQNIDFGIQYRPEHQVGLEKYISNVKVITSDAGENGAPLVDAKFKEIFGIVVRTDVASGTTEFLTDAEGNIVEVDRNANKSAIESAAASAGVSLANCEKTSSGDYIVTLAGTKLDEENSVGLVNLQYLPNDFEITDAGLVDAAQGFIYMNIDDDIMQGASIKIEYVFAGVNLSEVDRVNSRLSELRFRENNTVVNNYTKANYYDEIAIQNGATDTGYTEIDYSGARTARNRLFSEYYRYELQSDGITKKMDDNGEEIVYRVKNKNIGTDDNSYYGRYMGSVYYTGAINSDDVVAELKIDKVLDYIDNDLVFNVSDNMGNDHAWATTTSSELAESRLVQGAFRDMNTGDILPALTGGVILDNKNRAYDTPERSNLAMLVDDRVKDYASGETDITKNKDISKFLLPRVADGQHSYGLVKLTASKVISAEDLKEDMNYENIAEIVQYSSVTGRVTNLATTLGNVTFWDDEDPANPIPEWDEGNSESDTAVTEKVTLTPPTGLGRIQRTVRQVTKNAGVTLIVVIIVALACVGIVTAIRLYRKRSIK